MAKESILTISSTYSTSHNQNQFPNVKEPTLMFKLIEQIGAELNPAKLFQFYKLRVSLNNFKENTQMINNLSQKNPNKNLLALDFQLEGLYPQGYRVLYYEGRAPGVNTFGKNMAQNISDKLKSRYESLEIPQLVNARGNNMGFVNIVKPRAFVIIVGRAGAVKDTDTLKDPIKMRFLAIGYILTTLEALGLSTSYNVKDEYKPLYLATTYKEFYKALYPPLKNEQPKIEFPPPLEKKFKAFEADLINQEMSKITTELSENQKKFETIKYFDEMVIHNKERLKIYKESLERLALYSNDYNEILRNVQEILDTTYYI